MADKSFGVKDINLIGASGTPTIDSPNNLNINAVNVAISTDMSVGGQVSLGAGTSISSPATNVLTLGTNSVERLRIGSSGEIGIGGATYGTSGQFLQSRGSGNAIQWASAGSVMQVQQTVKTSLFTNATKGSYVAVTGLSVNITPVRASSKILVTAEVAFNTNNNYPILFHIYRGGSQITPNGNSTGYTPNNAYNIMQQPADTRAWFDQQTLIYYDTPSYTLGNQLTYQVYAAKPSAAVTDISICGWGASNITVMEVAQ